MNDPNLLNELQAIAENAKREEPAQRQYELAPLDLPMYFPTCVNCFKTFEAKSHSDRYCPACVTERGLELERIKQLQQQQIDAYATQIDLDNLRRQVLENQIVAHELYVKEITNVGAHRARMEKINLVLVLAVVQLEASWNDKAAVEEFGEEFGVLVYDLLKQVYGK